MHSKVLVLQEGISEEEAEKRVREKREQEKKEVHEMLKQNPNTPVVSAPYNLPPPKTRWERFEAWVRGLF